MHDAPWLKEAWREFGETERGGTRENARIVALFRDAGHPEIARDEVAWCAIYVGACLERTGLRATRSLLARSYLEWGTALAEPRPGAVAVLSRGRDPSKGHVGFWLGEAGADIVLLGGNQSNAVSVARYPKSRLLALRWPDAAKAGKSSATAVDIFESALVHVLDMEGGFTDDAHDPGGPTNLGITLAVFAAWRNVTVTAVNRTDLIRDLKAIDSATVTAIYRRRYWDAAQCKELPPALALMHFDAAVNHGVGAAIRFLQQAVGVAIDGEFGPQTRAAIAKAQTGVMLESYAGIRRRRYRALPHFWRFGRGWLRRVDATLAVARTLTGETSPASSPRNEGDTTMTTTEPGKWWGHSITIWGTIVTILSNIVPALAPVTGVDVSGEMVESAGRQVVDAVQSVGTLIGTLVTIYGRIRATGPLQKSLFKSEG